VLIFALGTLLMRSAGCVMNDLADWRYDAHVERTRNRPLPRVVSRREAWILASGADSRLLGLVLSLNRLTGASVIRGARLAATYPLTSDFSRFRRPISESRSASHSMGLRRDPRNHSGRGLVGCSSPTSPGRSPTIPNTRWWTATTICVSASDGCDHSRPVDVLAVMISYGVMLALLAGIGLHRG